MDNLLGELMGTMILVVFGCGVCANVSLSKSKAEGGGWICVATGWGLGLGFGVLTAINLGAPQGDLNPAVTLAKTMLGIYTVPQLLATAAAQTVGGFIGGVIVWLAFLPHWAETKDTATKLGVFASGGAVPNRLGNFLSEMIGTFFLVFIIWMIFGKAIGELSPGYGPYLVGMLLWAIAVSLGGTTGFALNPARDLGPRLAHAILPIAGKGDSDWGYAWVPIVAPLCGGLLAYVVATACGAF
ncbi:MAG: aquaporin family protein [Selenomonadaceae bacterium]|nr:aquaporin family protein [Selenomonadaceae bacterium]